MLMLKHNSCVNLIQRKHKHRTEVSAVLMPADIQVISAYDGVQRYCFVLFCFVLSFLFFFLRETC